MPAPNPAKQAAKAQGLKTFISDKPCPNGHIGERRVSNGACVVCDVARALAKYYSDKETWLRQGKEYYKNNPEKCKAIRTKYRLANPELFAKLRSVNKEEYAASHKNWRINNPKRKLFLDNKRRASKLRRTPKWADMLKIRAIYEDCPDGMQVDHIIPLQGELVSGLHVHNNLQYLTPSENAKKRNFFKVE